MQHLEVSGAVQPIYGSLGVKQLTNYQYTWHKIPEEQRSQMKVSRDCNVNHRLDLERR